MAEQDLASQGAAVDDAHQDDAVADPQNVQTDDTPEPIANLARDLGWTPREEWQGEPDKWKPAEQFIRDGRDIQQTTARELRSLREQMERLGGVTETIVQDRVASARADWEREFNQAVEDGDTARAHDLRKKEPAAPGAAQAVDPLVQRWVADNPWMETDPLAADRAAEISHRLRHLPVAEQLRQVDRAMRKEFPELFKAPTKPPPATQTAASRNTNASNRQKGFADMPAASQAVALDYEKRLGVPKEKTALSYWAEQEGVKR